MRLKVDTKVLELTTIYEASKELTSTLNLKKSLDSVMNILDKFIDMKYRTVVLSNPETRELSTFVALGINEEEKKLRTYRAGQGIIGKVFKSGSPINISDIRDEPSLSDQIKLYNENLNFSYICVPIKTSEKVIGTLGVAFYKEKVSFFMDAGVRILSMVASLIGQGVELSYMVEKEKQKLILEKISLRQQLKTKHSLENVIGQGDGMKEIFETVHRVAATTATVFPRGESGTGKELIARAIHYNSPRAKKPFIKINCTALPETLLETELFGHEKGSFTGAIHERKGRFELADGGTIFLDETGDIPVSTQMKLLRVLQERKFERLGSSKTISIDVRVIAATNQDLEKAMVKGGFREDLYYRLNVIPIFHPPLRERKEDIPILVEHFLQRFNEENNKRIGISDEVMGLMLEYSWPGNVRQLENCIERLVIMADRDRVNVEDLPYEIRTFSKQLHNNPETGEINKDASGNFSLTKTVKEMEKELIIKALQKCGWVKSRAATLLGISSRQVDYRINKYGIEIKKPWEES
ncbi:MAG: nif-specific transcriptional activator NifA [Deltaproteobacteria bacterium]|nr:nif-specific transcriptional activator NifA [Deltaproteobacteria bacterium]